MYQTLLSILKTRKPYYTYSLCNPPFQLNSSPNPMSFLLRNVDGAIMAWNNGDNNAQKTIWFITSYCLFVILISTQICTEKICIKYSKHWKGYVSFQLSGQIGLIWAVRNYSPNWHQFFHERPMTIFKLIFKKLPKSEKVGLPQF